MVNDSKTPRISVVMPAFNRASYIVESLQSIVDQSVRPIEVIVVDDGSTDGTAEVVTEFAKGISEFEIKFSRQENAGPSAARNAGLKQVRGDYVAFLDADDVWEKDKLAWQLELLNADPSVGAVYCNFSTMDSLGVLKSTGLNRRLWWADPKQGKQYRLFLSGNFCYGSASGVLIRKSALGSELFDEALRLGEDWEFWIRLSKRAHFALIDRPLVRIREHVSNLQKSQGSLAYYDFRVFVKWHDEILAEPKAKLAWEARFHRCLGAYFEGQVWAREWFERLTPEEKRLLRSALARSMTPLALIESLGLRCWWHLREFCVGTVRELLNFRRYQKLFRI